MTDALGRPSIHALLADGTTVRIRAVEPTRTTINSIGSTRRCHPRTCGCASSP